MSIHDIELPTPAVDPCLGEFAGEGEDYLVHTPTPPRPWINYLTNGRFASLCSQVGGGFAFMLDHRYNAITERGIHQATEDLPGRLIYIKDEESGEIWNANAHPITLVDRFQACHAMGETRVDSAYAGIASHLEFRVPPEEDAELWEVRLHNESERTRRLSVYACASFSLGHQALFEMETAFHNLFNSARWEGHGFVAGNGFWAPHGDWAKGASGWPWLAFMTATRRPAALCLDRDVFLGPAGSYLNPAAIQDEIMPSAPCEGRLLCGAFQWRITLKPGEDWQTGLALGVHDREDEANLADRLRRYEDPATYTEARIRTREHWLTLFAPLEVETPDSRINRMANHWNKKQLMVNFYFGRGPSYYHKGQYPGLRDSSQDTFGLIPLAPKLARENLIRLAGFFDADGRPPGGCNRIGLPQARSKKVDAPAWFALAVCDYVKETGDESLLYEHPIPGEGQDLNLLGLMRLAMERMLSTRGAHGLSLMGGGDWNDAANGIGAGGKGESVWLSQFVCYAVSELAPLFERCGQAESARYFREQAVELEQALQAQAWAGDRFIRAFKDDGTPVGDGSDQEGALWINSQTWAVISRTDTPERLAACLDTCERELATPWGMNKLAPAFTRPDPSIGLITAFRPGWKENGAVFSHANTFHIVARAMFGRGKDAVRLYRQLLPDGRPQDLYKMEPYVFSQFCAGSDSEDAGEGAFHWLSGTAAWMFRALTHYIYGIRPEMDGLRIDPAVDPAWENFSMKRTFRGAEYQIRFHNPDGAETGVKKIRLDGQLIQGTLLPLPTAERHEVEVWM